MAAAPAAVECAQFRPRATVLLVATGSTIANHPDGRLTADELANLIPAVERYMQAALDLHRADGHSVRPEDEARLSPLGHEHINLLGRYSFAVPESVARGELRPLRNPVDGGR